MDAMHGVAGQPGPNLTRTMLRVTDQQGATQLAHAVVCITCGWTTTLPDAEPEERALFSLDTMHTVDDCASRVDQGRGW